MSLTRTTAGLVLDDAFGRADSSTLGGDWLERAGNWSINSGDLFISTGSTSWVENDAASQDGGFVQVDFEHSNDSTSAAIFLRFGWASGSPNGYGLFWNFVVDTIGLRRLSGGGLSDIGTDQAKGLGTNTRYPGQLYVADGVQEAWVDGVSHSGSDTTHDALSGGVGIRRAGSSGSTRAGSVIWCTTKYIVVTGLPSGWKAKVRNSGASVVAEATESGGTATIDCSRFGSATELVPNGGWTDLVITDSGDTIQETYDATGVYPGDEYEFDQPITGTLNATLEPLTADLSGTIIPPIAGTLNATLEPLTANLSGVVQPPAFSKYDSFCAYEPLSFPDGWEVVFGSSESQFDVSVLAGATDGQILRRNTGASPPPTVIAPTEMADTPATVDIAARLRMNSSGDGERIGIAARASWGGSGATMYYLALFNTGTIFRARLVKMVDGARTQIFDTNFAWGGTGVWNWLRLRVEEESGGSVAIRSAWSRADSGQAMPTTWNDERTDSSSPITSGRAGMAQKEGPSPLGGGGTRDWDVVTIQTGGDAPPGSTNVAADEITAAPFDDGRAVLISIDEQDASITERLLHRSTTEGFTPSGGTLIDALSPSAESYLDEFVLPQTTYYYVTVVSDGNCPSASNEASATTGDGENAPDLRVGSITETTATLSVDPLSEYLQVEFRTYLAGVLVDSGIQSGAERFTRDLSGLTAETEYESWARVEYADGWSAWDSLTWSTIAFEPVGEDMGCPPLPSSYLWNPDSNPIDGTTRRGLGWFRPLPGEPLSGQAVAILRWFDGGQRWDIEISDDQGETWTTLIEDLPQTSADLDGLETWEVPIDTTLYADGQDYRLRATSTVNERVITSLTFPIDNAGAVRWWTHRGGDSLDGRFGKLWQQTKTGGLFGNPSDPIWVRGWDGGIGAYEGHNWALYADRDVPACLGADVTIRFYIWSGEGGLAGTQGRDDTETFDCGIGFFASGLSAAQAVGIVVGANNGVTYPIGCCDDLYTSTLGKVSVIGRSNTGQTFSILGSLAGEGTVSGGGDLADVSPLRKWYFKSCHRRPLYHFQGALSWLLMRWRHGNQPGHLPQFARTCGRRYEMYALRARVEVNPADHAEVTIKTRLDGIGVDPPSTGYWHSEKTVTMAQAMTEGAVGLVSRQFAQGNYPQGVRVFMSSSILPLEPGEPLEIEPDEPPPFQPPQEGAPCALVLQVYERDRETVAWEVGTDQDHVHPYLSLPEHYGEQEIDVVNGAATIGQVEVIVIDKAQTAGDQDSGWLTERMSGDGITAVHGRRCRLIRFISEELGWVVIADGPASSPQLDSTFAAYRWTIRDTRETERKVRAFVSADTSWLVPMGVEAGWYYWEDDDGDDNWLVEPTDPLFGEYRFESAGGGAGSGPARGRVLIRSTQFWPDGFQGLGSNVTPIAGQEIDEVAISESVYQSTFTLPEVLGDPLPLRYEWPDLEILWRVQGSGDPWTVVQPTDVRGVEGELLAKPPGSNIEALPLTVLTVDRDGHFTDDGAEDVLGVTAILLRGHLAEGSFPDHEAVVEVAVRYKGAPTDATPLHIEFNEDGSRKTTGQLLTELYDGVYGYPDPVTGEPVPTGIRYDPAALEQMTDPVYLRITEPIADARAWAEEHIYAPTGWVPALDNDGRISPVSQVPPETFDGLTDINNAVTEPVPNWDAGERIVNDLRITYPRYYQTDVSTADAADKLDEREIEIAFRDEQSITDHGEQSVRMALDAFAAPGDEVGRTRLGLVHEPGYQHAQNRKLYVFDRFKNGAQTIEVPVMRSVTATLRAGDWVTVDLSWFPDYLTRRRGMVTAGQIIAIHDVDCAWRILLIEEALPPLIEEDS